LAALMAEQSEGLVAYSLGPLAECVIFIIVNHSSSCPDCNNENRGEEESELERVRGRTRVSENDRVKEDKREQR
jgi:hypothetical protein